MTLLSPNEVRRFALLAATKVSLSAVLVVGCGGQVTTPTSIASESETGVADAATDTRLAETSPAVDSSTCGVTVERALSDAGDPATSTDPAVQACCKEILALWTFGETGGVSYEAARACCQVLGGEKWWEIASPACTPWGPPMPPSMVVA